MCMSKSCAEKRSSSFPEEGVEWGGTGVEDRRLVLGVAWNTLLRELGFWGERWKEIKLRRQLDCTNVSGESPPSHTAGKIIYMT